MDALRVAKVERVVLERASPEPPHARVSVEGTLHLTPHHLFFTPSADSAASSSSAESAEVWIPYPIINALQRLPQTVQGKYPLFVGTKTFDAYTLLFEQHAEGGAEDVWQSVRDCAVTHSVEQLYAFFYTLPRSPIATRAPLPSSPSQPSTQPAVPNPLSPLASSPPPALSDSIASVGSTSARDGWGVYSPRAEFLRQGVGSRTRAWRFTDINRDYAFSPTYPSKLVVPSKISDSVLAYAAKYRSKGRIPALTYLHWANHASITRSSQPMVGLKQARSAQDERLVECIFTSHSSPEVPYGGSGGMTPSPSGSALNSPPIYGATPTNLIIDARPTTNAMANVAKGAGTENMDHYKWGDKAYLGIDNIHVMRNSLKTVVQALAEADATGMPIDRERLRKSGWLRHLTAILDGALVIVRNVHINSSHVLIHCSDGWDRTSQLSAVAQLCLDPYYRTLDGFQVLVEKDWLSFGHMFLQRSGHLANGKQFQSTPDNIDGVSYESDDDFGVAVKGAQAFFASVSKQFTSSSHLKEVSPVFHQFLDCVRQIQRQFPTRFEFNESYLVDLHYHLYACQFGTFLFDSERQRRAPLSGKPYVERTVSAWDWLDAPPQRQKYLNPDYDASLDDRTTRDGDNGVLLPDPQDVQYWHRLFKRPDDEMNAPLSRFREEPPLPILEIQSNNQPHAQAAAALGQPPSSPSTPTAPGSFHPSAGTSSRPPPARAQPPAASPFALGAKKWNWNGISSGALSALNTLRAGATDAISQLRERAEEDELGRPFEPGTGIGEARGGARVPSEANPWDDPRPPRVQQAAVPVVVPGYGRDESPRVDPLRSALPAEPLRSAPLPTAAPGAPRPPLRKPSADHNPWNDSVTRSLADLTLAEASGAQSAGSAGQPPRTSKEGGWKEEKRDSDLEAALDGSKAWDPLGAA